MTIIYRYNYYYLGKFLIDIAIKCGARCFGIEVDRHAAEAAIKAIQDGNMLEYI